MELASNGTPRRRSRAALDLVWVGAALAMLVVGAGCGGEDDPVDPGDDCPPQAAKFAPSNANPFAQGRVVIVEHFTNDLCVPCKPVEEALRNIIASLGNDRVVTIGNHLFWPNANDPVYVANSQQFAARADSFGVADMPSVWIDGVKFSQPANETAMTERINEAEAVSPDYDVAITRAVIGDSLIVTTMVTKRAQPAATDDKLVVVVMETDVIYRTAEGECIEYDDAVRRFLTGIQGEPLEVPLDQTATFRHALKLSTAWASAKLEAVAFVQAQASKTVRGAGSTH